MRFYFDFISPYAYLAWTQIGKLAAGHDVALEPVPVLFAALLSHSGALGPAEIPLKRRYMWRNTIRLAAEYQVPFTAPPSHPFNPLLALRVATASPTVRVIDALFRAIWATGDGADSPESVSRALAGLSPDALLAAAATPETKAALRANTDAAIAAGVFGVPTFAVGDELFWGCDSLPHVAAALAGNDPLASAEARALADRFVALAPSAERPR